MPVTHSESDIVTVTVMMTVTGDSSKSEPGGDRQ